MEFNFNRLDALEWGVVIGASLVGGVWYDLRTGRIPNKLTFFLFSSGVIVAVWFGGLGRLGSGFAGAALMSFPYILAFMLGGCGAGDAKFMAGAGMWLGLEQSISALICVACLGVIAAVLKSIAAGQLRKTFSGVSATVYSIYLWFVSGRKLSLSDTCTLHSDALTLRYGVVIFAGFCVAGIARFFYGT